jgi:hypothetical protein
LGWQAVDDKIVLKDVMCGDSAEEARHCLDITYPVRRSVEL